MAPGIQLGHVVYVIKEAIGLAGLIAEVVAVMRLQASWQKLDVLTKQ